MKFFFDTEFMALDARWTKRAYYQLCERLGR